MSADKSPPPPVSGVQWKVDMACRILAETPADDQLASLKAAAEALAKAEAEAEGTVDALAAAGNAYEAAVNAPAAAERRVGRSLRAWAEGGECEV